MNKLLVIGDIHFKSSSGYSQKVALNFLKFLKNEINPKYDEQDYCVLLGDLVDSLVNPGSVVSYINNLYENLLYKFKQTFIIVGNHDCGYYKNSPELFYNFLSTKQNITLIDTPFQKINIANKKAICLPYVLGVGNIEKYYNENSEGREELKENYDFCFGHLTLNTSELSNFIECYDYKKYIKADKVIFGHLHSSSSTEHLCSVWANKNNESLPRRYFLEINLDTNEHQEIKIPNFLIYKKLKYPETPQKTRSNEYTKYETTIYEIITDGLKLGVKEFYCKNNPELFIYKISSNLKNITINNVEDNKLEKNSFFEKSDKQYFEEMCIKGVLEIDKKTKQKVVSILDT